MDSYQNCTSVVIPVYNGAAFIRDAIESVWRQRPAVREIIVVDDGSTDESPRLVESLPNVKLVRQSHEGVATARNTGVKQAQGEFLAFLDADDLWAADKLAAQLQVFETDPGVKIVAGRVGEFGTGEFGQASERTMRQPGDRAYTIGAMLIRRNAFLQVGFFDPTLRFGEFIDWHSRALALGFKECILDQVVLLRRLHSANTTRQAGLAKRDYLTAVKRHLDRKRAGRPEAHDSTNQGPVP